MASIRRLRICAANIGPNRFHQKRTVSWLTSMPRSPDQSGLSDKTVRLPPRSPDVHK